MGKITKSDVYKTIIDVQVQSGQGLSGIVKVKSSEYALYIDELIEEGLVKRCHTGGSIGHPESNCFYMPTKGYNVWEDEGTDGEYHKHKGIYLHFVRLYLGILEKHDIDDDRENLEKFISPSDLNIIRNPKLMKDYSKWLKRNSGELEVMLKLDNLYVNDISFNDDEIEKIKSKDWWKDNEIISKCLVDSEDQVGNEKKIISISNQLLGLYNTDVDKHKVEIQKAEEDIERSKDELFLRKKLRNWFNLQDENVNIKELIK